MTTETSERAAEERVITHDLFSREIRPIRNWNEWLERWQAAITLEEMVGLLHVGFNVSLGKHGWDEKEYNSIDRLIFYFGIADGWADYYDLLRVPTDSNVEYHFGMDNRGNLLKKSLCEIRQIVAQKAFDILCLNFFRSDLHVASDGADFTGCWERTIATERLSPVIVNFFRVQKGQYGGIKIRNLSRCEEKSRNEKQAVTFLLNLAAFLWRWEETKIKPWDNKKQQEETTKQNIEMRARVDASKLWMIEVLAQLCKLNVMEKWVLELNEACLAKLKEIALRNGFSKYDHLVKEDRQVATLDEACYLGSPAGWFLKRHELKKREHERLTAIREAERAQEEASRKIRELTPKS